MVTPIGAILKAATGDTTKSPGHGGFFSSVTGSKASHFKHNARDPFYFIYAVVTRTRAILRCGHGVTAKFRWTQIVSPVAALSIAPMGVTTPCGITYFSSSVVSVAIQTSRVHKKGASYTLIERRLSKQGAPKGPK